MEPRLLQLINNVLLFAIDGKPVKQLAVLLNEENERYTGHISFEAKSLDGNALADYASGNMTGDSEADALKMLNAQSKFFNIVYKQSEKVYEVCFEEGSPLPDWETDADRGDTLDDGDVGIFFEIDKERFTQTQSI